MATGASADGLFRCVYEGSISAPDSGIDRRPYHKNCGCALHKSRSTLCSHSIGKCKKNVSYPIRRSWSEGSLALAASCHSSPSSSPAKALPEGGRIQFELCTEEEEGDLDLTRKIDVKI